MSGIGYRVRQNSRTRWFCISGIVAHALLVQNGVRANPASNPSFTSKDSPTRQRSQVTLVTFRRGRPIEVSADIADSGADPLRLESVAPDSVQEDSVGTPWTVSNAQIPSATLCSAGPGETCRFGLERGQYAVRVVDTQTSGALFTFVRIPRAEQGTLALDTGSDVRLYVDLKEPAPGPGRRLTSGEFAAEEAVPDEGQVADAAEWGRGGVPNSGASAEQTDQSTRFEGLVLSLNSGMPIAGARVFVKGTETSSVTDVNGRFVVLISDRKDAGDSGEAEIAVVHPDYTSITARVSALEKAVVRLTPAALALEDVVISAPHIRGSEASFAALRRESLAVNDVVGAEQMSRSGDSHAAAALRRVTGLTLLDGKYVYVRGLGDRYSSITLNGSFLPSPEPTRRVVPLDIFPAGVLEGVVVQKTFTPDMPGEFGGGTLRLRTRRPPDESRARVSLSTEFSASGPRLSARGGGRDWTGLDDGTRALPESIRRSDRGPIEQGASYSAAEVEALGESLPNRYAVSRNDSPSWIDEVPFGASGEWGTTLTLGKWSLGGYLSGLYGRKIDDGTRTLKTYNASGGKLDSLDKDLKYLSTTRNYNVGALEQISLGFKENQRIELVSLLTRKTSDRIQIKEGSTGGGDDTIRTTSLGWDERELFFNQVSGSHTFLEKIQLDWRYSQSDARNYVPDSRVYRYELRGSDWLLSNRADGNSRSYTSLIDRSEDWGADFRLDFVDEPDWIWNYQLGLSSFYKRRSFAMRRFYFRAPDFLDSSIRQRPPEEIFTPENIAPEQFSVVETTRNTDTYVARNIIDAQYMMSTLSWKDRVSLVVGARVEHSRQEVLTFSLHDADANPESALLQGINVLPAVNLTLRFSEWLQLRGAWSQTVSRPDFRELSTASYFDDRLDMEVQGYSKLQNSELENLDARVELYGSFGSRFSLGGFRKNIRQPIERILLNVAGNENKVSYRNSKRAENMGYEVEFALNMGSLAPRWGRFVEISGNYSRITSEIELDLDDIANQVSLTSEKRALQGVSPYALNLALQFDLEGIGFQSSLVYNEIGSRITQLGTNGMPDVFEDPRQTLDLVLMQELGNHMKVTARVSNVLGEGSTTRQDGRVILDEPASPVLSLGASATF
jgi:hypothetical protein